MKATINKSDLTCGWLLGSKSPAGAYQLQAAPATEPRDFAGDPAFGDFNLPLPDSDLRLVRDSADDDADDAALLRDAIAEGDFESYSDFRRDELGL